MAIKQLSDGGELGTTMGQSAADKIAFHGVAPIVQRAGAIQAASILSASSYVTVASNTTAIIMEIQATLLAYGFWKGAA